MSIQKRVAEGRARQYLRSVAKGITDQIELFKCDVTRGNKMFKQIQFDCQRAIELLQGAKSGNHAEPLPWAEW